MSDLKLFYIKNCGILIYTKHTKILIDGLFGEHKAFGKMPSEVEKEIIFQQGVFEKINCLIFTHCHEDHFDADKVWECYNNNPQTLFCFPANGLNSLKEKGKNILGQRYLEMKGEVGTFQIGEVTISFFQTKHIKTETEERYPHYALVLELKEKKVLITGDMVFDDDAKRRLEKFDGFDIGFINLLVATNVSWHQNLQNSKVKKCFVYHIPSEEDDSYMYRKIALGAWKKTKEDCFLLLNSCMEINWE